MSDTPFDPTLMIETGADGRLVPGLGDVAQVRELARKAVSLGHVVIHLHGGLVWSQLARANAVVLAPRYRDARAFPVAFVWRTDPTIVCRNLDEIAGEDLFRSLLRLVARSVIRRVGEADVVAEGGAFDFLGDLGAADGTAESGATLPPATLTDEERRRFEAEVMADPALQAAVEALTNKAVAESNVAPADAARTHLDPAVLAEIRGAGVAEGAVTESATALASLAVPNGVVAIARRAGKVLARVLSRFARSRDHGVLATCVEEIARELYLAAAGSVLWDAIKRESADTFAQVDGEARGGRLFVDALAAEAAATGAPPRVTIVAHSAGAIFACHLLEALSEAGLRVTDLVFLAAAVRYSQLADTMTKLEADGGLPARLHFYGLSEECESGYWEVPPIYPRSLLYMVSGAAERDTDGAPLPDEPLVGMQRFFDRPDIVGTDDVHRLMRSERSDVRWIGRDAKDKVHKHGGLTDPEHAPTVVDAFVAVVAAPGT